MRIEAITRRKIVVELSAEDLDALDITYNALDYASAETRRVIWVILDRVRETTGCDIDPSGQLLIDAMPRPTGGCILFFTLRGAEPFGPAVAPEQVLRKQEQLTAVFEFPDINALLDCSRACAGGLRGESERLFTRSELYTLGERFRLLACPAREPAAMKRFFSEYAVFCGEDSFAADHTREHWQPVGESQSFERLGGRPAEAPRPRARRHFLPGTVYAGVDN